MIDPTEFAYKKVQSHINNISFPKTLGEFEYFMNDSEHFNV